MFDIYDRWMICMYSHVPIWTVYKHFQTAVLDTHTCLYIVLEHTLSQIRIHAWIRACHWYGTQTRQILLHPSHSWKDRFLFGSSDYVWQSWAQATTVATMRQCLQANKLLFVALLQYMFWQHCFETKGLNVSVFFCMSQKLRQVVTTMLNIVVCPALIFFRHIICLYLERVWWHFLTYVAACEWHSSPSQAAIKSLTSCQIPTQSAVENIAGNSTL